MMTPYNALLHLFPKSFRTEYADEMRSIFSRRRESASSTSDVASLWIETLLDVVPNAICVHADILAQDLKFSVRSLSRVPGFTFTAILVAALGVGATTAAFSVTDRVLVRPFPFRDSDRLVKIWERVPGYSRMDPSPATFRDWAEMAKTVETPGAYAATSMNLLGGPEPMRIQGAAVTANLLPILATPPILGRFFTPQEDTPKASGTVILSYSLWRDSFGAAASVLGRTLTLDEAPYVVIGVMPKDFTFPDKSTKMWTTIRFDDDSYADRTNAYLRVVARLKPGVTLQGAGSEMNVIAEQLERQYPKDNAEHRVTVVALSDEVPSQARLLLTALFGASLCVLLIACTNLASLLIARSLQRGREIAVRTALGAGRERLIRQLMTESVVLAMCGGGLGILLAIGVTPLLAQLAPSNLPLADVSQIDGRVLAFAALITTLTGIGFGIVPALRVNGEKEIKGLRDGGRGTVGGPKKLRSALVFAEIALSVVLLVSSGLMVRALWRVQQIDPGFESEGVLTLRTSLPLSRYGIVKTRSQFYETVLSEVTALPGVKSAAYVTFLPMVMRGGIWDVTFPGRASANSEDKASMRYVTPGFFQTLGVPIHQGRDMNAFDTADAPAVAVVSASFAQKHWPNQNPLGQVFNITFHDRIVVGVVGDMKVRGLERESEPQVYLSHQQVPDRSVPNYVPKDLAIRASGDPSTLIPAVRAIIQRADPQVPVSDVQLLQTIVDGETSPRAAQLRILAAFAAIAILLAGIGIHGLLAFTVSNRLPEIGVRMALGAGRSDILNLVARDGVRLAALGASVGLLMAYMVARGMAALLAGVSPADAPTFAVAAVVVITMTLLGALMPALRALRVDPTKVMRTE
ncbi:MAG: ABC transporter permease [Vicinamibacteria bacterium]